MISVYGTEGNNKQKIWQKKGANIVYIKIHNVTLMIVGCRVRWHWR